jgi:two-component system nitrate/nitrite response regulator NarL
LARALYTKPRIGLAAEHALLREGLRTLLETDRTCLVIHEAGTGAEAVRLTREQQPDVLVLDVSLPGLPDGDTLRAAIARPSDTAVIVLTSTIDRKTIAIVMDLGARGLVLKDCDAAVLLRAIRAVLAGECWVDRTSVADFAEALYRRCSSSDTPESTREYGLTEREREIVAAVAAAEGNKDIAQRFSISETTVKHHLTNVFDKLGVSSRLELAMFAVNHGLQASRLHHNNRHRSNGRVTSWRVSRASIKRGTGTFV